MAESQAEKDRRALELVQSGRPIHEVAALLNFRSTVNAQAAVDRALKVASAYRADRSKARQLDLARIDRMLEAFYPQALGGDEKSAEVVRRLIADRERLQDRPSEGAVTAAYEKTLAAMSLKEIDAAVSAAGMQIAQQIDFAAAHGTPTEQTKALYLMPHLLSVLRELNATPLARRNLASTVAAPAGVDEEPEDELDAFKKKRRGSRTKGSA